MLSLSQEILNTFPFFHEMSVLEIGDGSLKNALLSKSTCKNYSVNELDPTKQYDLVISNGITCLSPELLEIPNAYMAILEKNPNSLLTPLRESKKNGHLLLGSEYQKICWKSHAKSPFQPLTKTTSKITFQLSGGRLGDNLIAYSHAKWASLITGVPILLNHFPKCQHFAFSILESHDHSFRLNRTSLISKLEQIHSEASRTKYTIPYFPESLLEYEMYPKNYGAYFAIDWEDPFFKQELRKSLAPRNAPKPLEKPLNRITVAIHLRRGGAVESIENARNSYPDKFPSDEFYKEQLYRLLEIHDYAPHYVYLFTDDLKPEKLLKEYQMEFKGFDIIFDYGKLPNDIDDFFAMGDFDCLIRGGSNFSLMAEYYGNIQLACVLTRCHLEQKRNVVDEIRINYRFNSPNFQ